MLPSCSEIGSANLENFPSFFSHCLKPYDNTDETKSVYLVLGKLKNGNNFEINFRGQSKFYYISKHWINK